MVWAGRDERENNGNRLVAASEEKFLHIEKKVEVLLGTSKITRNLGDRVLQSHKNRCECDTLRVHSHGKFCESHCE